MQDSEHQHVSRPAHDRRPRDDEDEEYHEREGVEVPANALLYALVAGVGAGILGILLNIAVTFLYAPLFQQAAREGQNINYNTALTVVGVQCLNFVISLGVCFLAGYIVGRIAILRRFGFYTGALAGIIMYVASLLVRYIPGYPGNASAGTATNPALVAGGIITIIVFLLIWGFIGGLVSLWGATMATRRRRSEV